MCILMLFFNVEKAFQFFIHLLKKGSFYIFPFSFFFFSKSIIHYIVIHKEHNEHNYLVNHL